jgi:hypothetical protein
MAALTLWLLRSSLSVADEQGVPGCIKKLSHQDESKMTTAIAVTT